MKKSETFESFYLIFKYIFCRGFDAWQTTTRATIIIAASGAKINCLYPKSELNFYGNAFIFFFFLL